MDLRHNPFYILGASLTDNKRRIMELAEEKSLFGDEEAIEEAKTILLDPIRRIDAELSWFPELDADSAQAMAAYLVDGKAMPTCRLSGMSRINGKAELMSRTQYDALSDKNIFANDILVLARGFRDFDNDVLLDKLNLSRLRGGFSEITDEYLFVDKIDNRRSEVLRIIQNCMDSISIETLLHIFYQIAYQDTDGGNIQASILVEDIVRSYENNIMTQEFMENEENAIRGLLESIKQSASDEKHNPAYVMNLAKALNEELRKWQKVVSAMQIVAVSHGKEHLFSKRVLANIRSVYIELNNNYDMPELSLELLNAIERTAADRYIPSFMKEKDTDVIALTNIIGQKRDAERNEKERQREFERRKQIEQQKYEQNIAYETKIGRLFKDTLRFSIDGIEWKEEYYPIEQITGVRWGVHVDSVNRRSINLFTITTYTVGFLISHNHIEINPNNKTQYIEIVDRLWKTAGVKIMLYSLGRLKKGIKFNVGKFKFHDNGVELEKDGFFSKYERKFFEWKDVKMFIRDGNFVISSKDEDFSAESSYLYNYNTHIWETMVRNMFKYCNSNDLRLSNLLNMK